MSIFKDIEKKLETIFEGMFKKGFSASIQPIEIAKEAAGVIEEHKIVGSEVLVPSRIDIYMNGIDLLEIKGYIEEYKSEIRKYLENYSAKNGYIYKGKFEVNFSIDEDLGVGYYHIVTPLPIEKEKEALRERPVKRDTSTMIMSAEESDELLREIDQLDKRVRPHLIRLSDGAKIPLTRSLITIGRSKTNDLVIDDESVSRKHAEIIREGNGFVLIDLGSTNGTLINGKKIDSKHLKQGDVIEFNKQRFRFITMADE